MPDAESLELKPDDEDEESSDEEGDEGVDHNDVHIEVDGGN